MDAYVCKPPHPSAQTIRHRPRRVLAVDQQSQGRASAPGENFWELLRRWLMRLSVEVHQPYRSFVPEPDE